MFGADAGADEKLERREVGEEIGVKLDGRGSSGVEPTRCGEW